MNTRINFCVFRFLGNEALHLLTSGTKQELRVDLQKFSGKKAYAKYSIFSVGNKSDKYKLTIGGYRGTGGKIIRKKKKSNNLRETIRNTHRLLIYNKDARKFNLFISRGWP